MKKVLGLLLTICCGFTFLSASAQAVAQQESEPDGLTIAMDAFQIADGQSHIFDIELESDGMYLIELEYKPEKDTTQTPEIGVSFNQPFSKESVNSFLMTRVYTYKYENERFFQDEFGNERIPDQVELNIWQTACLYPSKEAGYSLRSGANRLYITGVSGNTNLRSLRLKKAADFNSYAQYIKEYPVSKTPNHFFKQEAELLYQKSDLNISVCYDRTSPNISPNSPSSIRYNLLGGSSFSKDGQWVSWVFDVPSEGWYYFDLYYRQNIIDGMAVHRTVRINDEILFDELNDVIFAPSKSVTAFTLGNDKNEFAFYLKPGSCKLSLEVTMVPLEEALALFKEIIRNLNSISNKINVVVGETVDMLRDYDLANAIPKLQEELKDNALKLKRLANLLSGSDKKSGENAARVEESIRVLEKMVERPRDIPKHLAYFRSHIATLSTILGNIETQPLELDYIVLRSAQSPKEKATIYGIWDVIWFRLQSFMNSFMQDYQSIGSGGSNHLSVWVGGGSPGFTIGREHAQIVNELILDSYSPKTQVYANVSLVDSSVLIQAIASGKGPDVALFIPKETIANLYYRDAVVPLNEIENFSSVKSRFTPSSMIALETGGKLYALPEIQIFQMLFYRTDILNQLELKIPDTWDDFYHTVKRLQIEQLKAGILESPLTFEMFLLQHGSTLYNEKQDKTNLTTQAAVEAFICWTDLYYTYKMPAAFDMLNRFRSGQMPIMMAPSNFYSQLSMAAPEIHGLWAMAPIPATLKDGKANRAQSSITSGAIVVRHAGKQDYETPLDFINWWTSTDIQSRFAQASEIRIGVSSRYFPTNYEVFEKVFWSAQEKQVLSEQWKFVWDTHQTPASYFVQRNLSNAFRRVVYNGETPRDVIYRYGREVDGELTRKRIELGLEGNP